MSLQFITREEYKFNHYLQLVCVIRKKLKLSLKLQGLPKVLKAKNLHLCLRNMDMSNCDLSLVLILLWISQYNLRQAADNSVSAGC